MKCANCGDEIKNTDGVFTQDNKVYCDNCWNNNRDGEEEANEAN
jgi:hypothetical protein